MKQMEKKTSSSHLVQRQKFYRVLLTAVYKNVSRTTSKIVYFFVNQLRRCILIMQDVVQLLFAIIKRVNMTAVSMS